MADARIGQKDEDPIGYTAGRLVDRKPDAAIGLLLDCFDRCPGATLTIVTYDGRSS